MKKNIGILFLVLILAAGVAGAFCFFYSKHAKPLADLQAAWLVPPDSISLLEITDCQRSQARWKETALYKISQEPEVAAFLAKPKSLPPDKQVARLEHFQDLNPKELFIAVTGQAAAGPKVIAGFDFTGKKGDAQALVDDLKSDLKDQYPDGKSDILKYGSSEIETFAFPGTTVATVFDGPWFFASNDLDLLESTIDRVDGKTNGKSSLRDNPVYQAALAKLPKDSDAVAFVQTKGIMDALAMMLSASANMDNTQLDELKKIQSISASMKFDGEKMRDAIYISKPGGEARPPLALHSLAYTSPDTIIDISAALDMKKAPVLPSPDLDRTGILSILSGLQQTLAQAGLGFDDFKAAFGPEFGTVVNLGHGIPIPTGMLSLDVRDQAKAQKFVETLATGWQKKEADGVQYYALQESGISLLPITPVLALTDKTLLFGLDPNSVKKVVQTAKTDGARIDKSADFQTASALVGKPTDSFAYIDTRALFDRAYDSAAVYLKTAALLSSQLSNFGDFSKLPSTSEPISKHLSPIVYSQYSDKNGTMVESAGPVTFTGVIFCVAVGAGVSSAFHELAPNMPTPSQPGTTSVPLQMPPDTQVQSTPPTTPAQP